MARIKTKKAYRTIGEASQELNLPTHVLRFWETQFPQLRPMKRAGGRRYYGLSEIKLLMVIKYFLREKEISIKEAKQLLTEKSIDKLILELKINNSFEEEKDREERSSLKRNSQILKFSNPEKERLKQVLSKLETAYRKLSGLKIP